MTFYLFFAVFVSLWCSTRDSGAAEHQNCSVFEEIMKLQW